jgi:tetratricopeptide (TPR) repeat protein
MTAPSPTPRLALALAVLLTLLAPSPAHSQPRPTPPQARELVREGNSAYRIGRFEDALAAYERAYKLFPDPRLLYNLAQCHTQLRHYDRAIFLYQSFLDQSPQVPDRPRIEQTIAELKARADAERMKAAPAPVPVPPANKTPLLPQAAPAPLTVAAVPAAPTPTTDETPRPWYKRWYVWTAVGLLVAGGVAAGVVLGTRGGGNLQPPGSALGNHTLFGNGN